MNLANFLLTVELTPEKQLGVVAQMQLAGLIESAEAPLENKLKDMAAIRDAVIDWYNVVSKRLEEKHAATRIDHQNTP